MYTAPHRERSVTLTVDAPLCVQNSRMRVPRLKAAPLSDGRRASDGHTLPRGISDSATHLDDLDDWKSSVAGDSEGDGESVLGGERTTTSIGGASDAAWHHGGDVLSFKGGCAPALHASAHEQLESAAERTALWSNLPSVAAGVFGRGLFTFKCLF